MGCFAAHHLPATRTPPGKRRHENQQNPLAISALLKSSHARFHAIASADFHSLGIFVRLVATEDSFEADEHR
jgi:hypothetical protein